MEKAANMVRLEARHEAAQKLTEEQQQQAAEQIHRLALKCVHLKTPDAASNKKRRRVFEEEDSTPQKNLCSSFTSVSKSVDSSSTISSKANSLCTQPSSLLDTMDPNYKFGDFASIVKARTTHTHSEGTMKGISMAMMMKEFHKKLLFIGVPQD